MDYLLFYSFCRRWHKTSPAEYIKWNFENGWFQKREFSILCSPADLAPKWCPHRIVSTRHRPWIIKKQSSAMITIRLSPNKTEAGDWTFCNLYLLRIINISHFYIVWEIRKWTPKFQEANNRYLIHLGKDWHCT